MNTRVLLVTAAFEAAAGQRLREKLEEKGIDAEIRVAEDEEVNKCDDVVIVDFSEALRKMSRDIQEKFSRVGDHTFNWFPEDVTFLKEDYKEYIDPVIYKMPKYKAPQRAVIRPRQSVMRGK